MPVNAMPGACTQHNIAAEELLRAIFVTLERRLWSGRSISRRGSKITNA
jgi:hypothetical protein